MWTIAGIIAPATVWPRTGPERKPSSRARASAWMVPDTAAPGLGNVRQRPAYSMAFCSTSFIAPPALPYAAVARNHAAAPVRGESASRTAAGVRWRCRSTSQCWL